MLAFYSHKQEFLNKCQLFSSKKPKYQFWQTS